MAHKEPIEMEKWDVRTRTLIGDAAADKLQNSRVLVVGLGGVGGYAAEMLCRSGVGNLTLIDADNIEISNLNRQLISLHNNIGMPKAEAFRNRFADINPTAKVYAKVEFLTPENAGTILDRGFDFVFDCIDTVAPKVAFLCECMRRGIPVISSMGAGGRLDPTKVVVTDLWATRDDGLARAVRQRMKKAGIRRPLKVVASTEVPIAAPVIQVDGRNKLTSPGSFAPVVSTFGIFMAAEAIKAMREIRDKI